MDNSMVVTDEEINELRNLIGEHKKREEYARLKRDLHNITFQANHTLTEFDGGMKQVDIDRVLSTGNRKQSLSEIFIARLIKMCALRPIIGNLIGVTLAMISIFSMHGFLNIPDLALLKSYLSIFIEIAAGVQILKSASRSLVLPIGTVLFGAVIANQLTVHQLFLNHTADFYQAVMITGLIGIAVSVFSID
jgi:hypothetical protein